MKKLDYLSCEDLKALASLLIERGELDVRTDHVNYRLTFNGDFSLVGKAEVRENDSLLQITPNGTSEVVFKLADFITQVEKQHKDVAGELCIGDERYIFTSAEELTLILRVLDELKKRVKDCQTHTVLDRFEDFLVGFISLLEKNNVHEEADDISIIRAVRRKERERAEIEEQKSLTEMVKKLDQKVQEKATPIRLVLFSLLAFFIGVIFTATIIEYRIKKEESKVVLEPIKPIQKRESNVHGSSKKPLESTKAQSGNGKLP